MNFREKLLELRSKLAYNEKEKHSFSFSDEELERLLKEQPKSLDDLGKIKGFPRKGKRVSAYGQYIVDIFNNKGNGFTISGNSDDLKVSTIKTSNLFS